MKKTIIISVVFLLAVSSCAPKITTSLTKTYSPLDSNEEVRVFGLDEASPKNSEELGEVKIGDTGFSTNCGWEVVIEKAKNEARKIGGNAIKITKHTPPSAMGSSCHRITAKILSVKSFDNLPVTASVDSSMINADYAVLHIYRHSGAGTLVSYDLHLGDTVICRVTNKWKKTIKIKTEGFDTLWARTEVKEELPINIKHGNRYYVRCGITMGAFVGHPQLELVDNETGKAEFQSIKYKEYDNRDIIYLNDGSEIECILNREDNVYVYYTVISDGKELENKISRTKIRSIKRGE